jgi:hypothetical protein
MLKSMRERRAYVVLVLICIFLCGATLAISGKTAHDSDKQMCIMLVVEKQYAPAKPADPKANPKGERVWQLHVARLKLAEKLGC